MEAHVKQVAIANIIRIEGLSNAEQAEVMVNKLAETASKLSGKTVAQEWREIISFYYQADI